MQRNSLKYRMLCSYGQDLSTNAGRRDPVEKKFNWCSVVPTERYKKPFGGHRGCPVEGFFYCRIRIGSGGR